MGIRRKGRILAFQALYAHELSGIGLAELQAFAWLDPEDLERVQEESRDFARLLIAGTLEKLADVDACIVRQLEHWDFSRLNKVDLAILRVSVYCLLYQADIPHTVTIDEAIDIAKEFGTDDSYRFINGVLDGIRKQREA
jgi:N utilization substance protein B